MLLAPTPLNTHEKETGPARQPLPTVEQGSTPEEIARYFALHGGNMDPYINKQSPGGPFDSGFFFDRA